MYKCRLGYKTFMF